MRKTNRLKKVASIAAVVALAVTLTPSGVMTNGLGVNKIVYADEQGQTQSKVLDTIWNEVEIGTHEGTGSYTYDATAKTVTITGAGTEFGKDSGKENCFYSYVDVKGATTIVAKITPDANNNSGFAGIIAKNDASDESSMAAGFYYDYSKNQSRVGRHGGAATISSDMTTPVYVKLEFSTDACYYTVAKDSEFTDIIKARNGMGVTGLDPKTVGFFATEGNKITLSDVMITSKYTQDDASVKKVVFDSNVGELKPVKSTSAAYSGKYDSGNSYKEVADGNVLKITQKRSAAVKGNIREDKGVDYLLFPETTDNLTITADVTINSVDSGTDKQGIAMGQFIAQNGSKTSVDTVHFQKNKVFQHTYSKSGVGGCGDPKTATLDDAVGSSFSITYTKSADNKADIKVVKADGTVLVDSAKAGTSIDLTQDVIDSKLQSGESVQYGFAFTGISVDLSNVKLINKSGEILYDMNDYYIATGVAPVVDSPIVSVAEDRNSINLIWNIATEGSGNIKYIVYVSKDGADYVKSGDTKVPSYSFSNMTGDGSYKFKIVPMGGDTLGTAIETDSVTYQTPLAQTEVTVQATDKKISLSWTAVDGATSYEVFRSLGSDGTVELIKTTSDTAYEDTNIKAEEPYYYYVVAKNANNSSNPSKTLQVLASVGHTGTYVYESEAAKLTVTAKSNDTLTSDTASIAMKSDKAGTVKLVINGKEVSSQKVKADEGFILNASLEKGRNNVEVLLIDDNNKTTRKAFNFVSNPVYDIVVDSAFTGTDGDVVDGHATYKTVQSAVNSVPTDNTESKVIFIKNGEYNERVTIDVPNVSLLGEDAEKTHIYYSAAVSEGTAVDMWTRNAMYVGSNGDGFTAENLTVENSFAYTNGSDQQADALCIVADKTACVNVRLVGYQDTLLTDSRIKGEDGNYEVTRQYFYKCYITGNVDFIYGAGSSYFDDCDIVARYTSYKPDGCFTAPRTYASTDYGMVFNDCRFLAEDGVGDDTYRLSRPWGKDASTTFINCYMGRAVSDVGYGDMSGNSYKNARFSEYASYGPGYVLNNDRPLLSSTQVAKYSMDMVMGDFDPVSVVKGLYLEKSADISEDNKDESTDIKAEDELPKTGDAAPIAMLITLLGLSGLGLLSSRKKRV